MPSSCMLVTRFPIVSLTICILVVRIPASQTISWHGSGARAPSFAPLGCDLSRCGMLEHIALMQTVVTRFAHTSAPRLGAAPQDAQRNFSRKKSKQGVRAGPTCKPSALYETNMTGCGMVRHEDVQSGRWSAGEVLTWRSGGYSNRILGRPFFCVARRCAARKKECNFNIQCSNFIDKRVTELCDSPK